MGEQVGDYKLRVALILAEADGDLGAVLAADDAVKRQGDGGPLILLDAAVVMGLEESEVSILIKRIGLEVEPRGVDMGGDYLCAALKALFAEYAQDEGLALVVVINLVAGLVAAVGVKRDEAVLLGKGLDISRHFTFGLAAVKEINVIAAEAVGGLDFAVLAGECGVLGRIEKLVLQSVGGSFFTHDGTSFLIYRDLNIY